MLFWIGSVFKIILTFFEKVLAVSQKCQDTKIAKNPILKKPVNKFTDTCSNIYCHGYDYRLSPKSALNFATSFSGQLLSGANLPVKNLKTGGSSTNFNPPTRVLLW